MSIPSFEVQCQVGSFSTIGKGKTERVAKHNAQIEILLKLAEEATLGENWKKKAQGNDSKFN